jgi:hypothetical protein
MVLSDDNITDEKLVDQLEDMRTKELSQRRSFLLSVSCPSPTYQAVLKDSYAEYPPQPDEFGPDDLLRLLVEYGKTSTPDLSRNAANRAQIPLVSQNTCKRWNGYFSSTHHVLLPSTPDYGQ